MPNTIEVYVHGLANETFSFWWHHVTQGTDDALPHFGDALGRISIANPRLRIPDNGSTKRLNELVSLVDCLSELLHHEESRRAALTTLCAMQPLIPTIRLQSELLDLLLNEDKVVRWKAARVIGKLESNGRLSILTGMKLKEMLNSSSSHVVLCALKSLEHLSHTTLTDEIFAAIARFLSDERADVRAEAACAVARFRDFVTQDSILPRFLALLSDANEHVRDRTSFAFVNLCRESLPTDQSLLSHVLELMEDRSSHARRAAAHAALNLDYDTYFAGIGPILEQLCRLLDDEDEDVVHYAVSGLQWLGHFEDSAIVETVVPRLTDLLYVQDEWLCERAVEALEGIRGNALNEQVISRLVELLDSPTYELTLAALRTLGNHAPEAAPQKTIECLVEFMHADDTWVIEAAARTCSVFGQAVATEHVLRCLEDLLQHQESSVRLAAASALVNIKVPNRTKELETCLDLLLKDEHLGVRQQAIDVLATLAEDQFDVSLVSRLMVTLQDQDHNVRGPAEWRIPDLWRAGDQHTRDSILTDLLELIRDDYGGTRESAAKTISAITTDRWRIVKQNSSDHTLVRVADLARTLRPRSN